MVATLTSGSGGGGGIADNLDLLALERSLTALSFGWAGFFTSSFFGFSGCAVAFLGDMLTLLSPRTFRAD